MVKPYDRGTIESRARGRSKPFGRERSDDYLSTQQLTRKDCFAWSVLMFTFPSPQVSLVPL